MTGPAPSLPAADPVTCPACGACLGSVVQVADTQYLQLGAALLTHGALTCAACLAPYYWSNDAWRLARLLERRHLLGGEETDTA
jgi:hypothetical protein